MITMLARELHDVLGPRSGPNVRRLLGLLLIVRGMVYLAGNIMPAAHAHLADPLNVRPYIYGWVILTIGVGLLITRRQRHTTAGRMAAALATAVCLFVAGGDFASFYYPQIPEWVIVAYFAMGEAAVAGEDECVHEHVSR